MSTHNIPFSVLKRKITINCPKSAAVGFFQRTEERVRNSRGRRAISVRATEVLLYPLSSVSDADQERKWIMPEIRFTTWANGITECLFKQCRDWLHTAVAPNKIVR